jgi:hypothetical protein
VALINYLTSIKNAICINCQTSSSGRVWIFPLLGHGSSPTLIFFPFPTLYSRPSSITIKDFKRDFHIIVQFSLPFSELMIHSSIDFGCIYFWLTTLVHKLSLLISLQLELVASAFVKKMFFLIPTLQEFLELPTLPSLPMEIHIGP